MDAGWALFWKMPYNILFLECCIALLNRTWPNCCIGRKKVLIILGYPLSGHVNHLGKYLHSASVAQQMTKLCRLIQKYHLFGFYSLCYKIHKLLAKGNRFEYF